VRFISGENKVIAIPAADFAVFQRESSPYKNGNQLFRRSHFERITGKEICLVFPKGKVDRRIGTWVCCLISGQVPTFSVRIWNSQRLSPEFI
jgi:hypothetical protein